VFELIGPVKVALPIKRSQRLPTPSLEFAHSQVQITLTFSEHQRIGQRDCADILEEIAFWEWHLVLEEAIGGQCRSYIDERLYS
jgi:hypothetical protein